MLEAINGFLSGKLLIVLVVGLGTYFTIKTRFVQLRYFLHMFKVFKDSLSVSVYRTHLQSPQIKGYGVHLKIRGHLRP